MESAPQEPRRQPPPRLQLRGPEHFENGEPEQDGNGLGPESTLTRVFHDAFKPIWASPFNLSELTIDEYERSLELWRLLAPDPDGDGHEPRLWELEGISGDYIAGRFMGRLADQPGNKRGTTMSVGTQRKHCRNMNKLLSFAGPKQRTRHGVKNLHLIDEPTLIIAPSPDGHAPEGDWTFEEVRLMWLGAARMESHKLRAIGIDPVAWWRALVVVAAHTGLRRGQLLGLDFADLSPPFVLVRPMRSKRRSGRKQYLSAEALAAIESIRTRRTRIFPWPYVMGQTKRMNVRYLDSQLRKLAERSGLAPQRWFGWNGFRKLVAGAAFDIGEEQAAQAVLGHSRGSQTAMKHYVPGIAQAKRAAHIIDQLPSARPENRDDSRQRQLF